MPFLIAAVVLVGAIAVLNLLLTMAVIRRLRRNESNMAPPMMDSGPKVGSALPEFNATSVAGDEVDHKALAGSAGVVAFFSTTCSACKPAVPQLISHVESSDFKPNQVLVVITGEGDEREEFTEMLSGKATIVTEGSMGELTTGFSINAFPSFVHFDAEGTVTRSHSGSGTLAEAA